MLCFLTERHLKPGSFDAFREAWEPTTAVKPPPEFIRAYHIRSLEDPDHVISFGLFEGGKELVERYRADEDFQAMRARQLEGINEHVASIGADAIIEVVEEYVPANR